MGINDNLNQDIRNCINELNGKGHSDQVQILRRYFESYIMANKEDQILGWKDLRKIVGDAKALMSNEVFPLRLGDDKTLVPESYQPLYCITRTTISHLNYLDCLKRLPKFDIRK
jgi:hypothetical protein